MKKIRQKLYISPQNIVKAGTLQSVIKWTGRNGHWHWFYLSLYFSLALLHQHQATAGRVQHSSDAKPSVAATGNPTSGEARAKS